MARVSLIDEQSRPELSALIAKIRGARGKLINLYGMLLHTPEVASAWLDFNNSIRFKSTIDDRLRELAILRIATLNKTDYVLGIHRSGLAQQAGVTEAQIGAISNWRDSDLFAPLERALLAYVDAMTRDIEVPDDVFAGLRQHFDERQTVELTVLAGCYNMHTRVMRALRLDPEPS